MKRINKKKLILILSLFGVVFLTILGSISLSSRNPKQSTAPSSAYGNNQNLVYVKYRGYVNIGSHNFAYLDTSKSSFVRGAWYDSGNNYIIINLNGTYYHYCGIPLRVWSAFSNASSFGSFYNVNIKGNFDCRVYFMPEYAD